ncbi:related to Nuclease Le3 (C-terminal fragment), partial [Sporisorium scitamineum]
NSRYDPLIRFILKEGLGQPALRGKTDESWWENVSEGWSACQRKGLDLDSLMQVEEGQLTFSSMVEDPGRVDDTDLPLCPYLWTKPMHSLVCKYAFTSPVPAWEPTDSTRGAEAQPSSTPLPEPELDEPEYVGRIERDKVIHKQLAKAGLRLAAVLNTLLLPADADGSW